MASIILSPCLLFKNEVHRTTTLPIAVRVAYVKCITEFGQGKGQNCVKMSLGLVLYTEICVDDEIREN